LAPSPAGKGIVRTRGGRGAKAAVVVALALIVPSVPVPQAPENGLHGDIDDAADL